MNNSLSDGQKIQKSKRGRKKKNIDSLQISLNNSINNDTILSEPIQSAPKKRTRKKKADIIVDTNATIDNSQLSIVNDNSTIINSSAIISPSISLSTDNSTNITLESVNKDDIVNTIPSSEVYKNNDLVNSTVDNLIITNNQAISLNTTPISNDFISNDLVINEASISTNQLDTDMNLISDINTNISLDTVNVTLVSSDNTNTKDNVSKDTSTPKMSKAPRKKRTLKADIELAIDVKKRDGRVVKFDTNKIRQALQSAFRSIKKADATIDDLVSKIINQIKKQPIDDILTVEIVQDIVEDTLLKAKEFDVAKAYIRYRAKRTQMREANMDLINLYRKIHGVNAEELELKRDNANVNGNSSMGIMLKIGTESNKYFLLEQYLKPEYSQMHKEGYVHLHDLDMSNVTFNCLVPDTELVLQDNNSIFFTDFNYFNDLFTNNIVNIRDKNIKILSRDGKFVNINIIMRRYINELVYKIIFNNGRFIIATADHILPIIRNEQNILISTKDIQLTDLLIPTNYDIDVPFNSIISHELICINSIEQVHYNGYVYDFETEDHYFSANGIISHNCCQLALDKLFKGGFSTGHGHLREPNSIRSYAALACIAIQSNQNEQFGGQSINLFDFYMSDGVRKSFKKLFKRNILIAEKTILRDSDLFDSYVQLVDDKLLPKYLDEDSLEIAIQDFIEHNDEDTYSNKIIRKCFKFAFDQSCLDIEEETHQAMEAVVHNFNTLASRAGSQVPFSSLNLGCDTSNEGRLITKELLNAVYAGLGRGETSIFPIVVFQIKSGINYNPTDPNYDLFKQAMKCSAKRLFPTYMSEDATYNAQYYHPNNIQTLCATMGCRTRVMGNINGPEESGSRGNFAFTTINLPMLAIEAEHSIPKFFQLFDKYIQLAHDYLLERFNLIAQKHVYNFPFMLGQKIYMGSEHLRDNDTILEVLKHSTLSIGFVGLAECLVALIGQHHGQSEAAQKLGLIIISHLRAMTDQYTKIDHLNWSTFASPAESAAGRLCLLARKKYGIIDGVTDKEYYTNSMHIPVNFPISVAKKIELEAPYHEMCNAGEQYKKFAS